MHVLPRPSAPSASTSSDSFESHVFELRFGLYLVFHASHLFACYLYLHVGTYGACTCDAGGRPSGVSHLVRPPRGAECSPK